MARWDEIATEATTISNTSIIAVETNPSTTHAMNKITWLNALKAIFNGNLWLKGLSASNPPAGYMTVYADVNGFLFTKDESGNIRRLQGSRYYQLECFTTPDTVIVGDDKKRFDIPIELSGMNLVYCLAEVDTVSSSGAVTIMIRNVTDSVDVLSTALTIDANEYKSTTAATPYVIDGTKDDVVEGDTLAIDVDGAGTGTKGLRVTIGFQYP